MGLGHLVLLSYSVEGRDRTPWSFCSSCIGYANNKVEVSSFSWPVDFYVCVLLSIIMSAQEFYCKVITKSSRF